MGRQPVRAKKHLGQHFLRDERVIQNIADAIQELNLKNQLVEVGPGDGALTSLLLDVYPSMLMMDVDLESIAFLRRRFPMKMDQVLIQDFLQADFPESCTIVGNFPYNISSQIVFKILEDREKVTGMVGMFQKEVAERICAGPGSKVYGILSVLAQAYYDTEYLFTVDEHAFDPPPKVKSGVIRFSRKDSIKLDCDERLFFSLVKRSFNQRRKMIRKSLKDLFDEQASARAEKYLTMRPEELSVDDFIALTNAIGQIK